MLNPPANAQRATPIPQTNLHTSIMTNMNLVPPNPDLAAAQRALAYYQGQIHNLDYLNATDFPDYFWRGYWQCATRIGRGDTFGLLTVQGALYAGHKPSDRNQGPRAYLRGTARVLNAFLDFLEVNQIDIADAQRDQAFGGRVSFSQSQTIYLTLVLFNDEVLQVSPIWRDTVDLILSYRNESGV